MPKTPVARRSAGLLGSVGLLKKTTKNPDAPSAASYFPPVSPPTQSPAGVSPRHGLGTLVARTTLLRAPAIKQINGKLERRAPFAVTRPFFPIPTNYNQGETAAAGHAGRACSRYPQDPRAPRRRPIASPSLRFFLPTPSACLLAAGAPPVFSRPGVFPSSTERACKACRGTALLALTCAGPWAIAKRPANTSPPKKPRLGRQVKPRPNLCGRA